MPAQYNSSDAYVNSLFTYAGMPIRTATGSGQGTQTASGGKLNVRFATGSGTGTSSATAFQTAFRTSNSSGSGTQSATGFVVKSRSAQVSGTGTSTATRLVICLRTGQGSGAGTQSANWIVTGIRTGSGSGTGASSSTFKRERFRISTSSGTSSQIAITFETIARSAIGTGASEALRTYGASINYNDANTRYDGEFSSAFFFIERVRQSVGAGVGSGTATHPDILTDGYWGQLL